MASNSPAVFCFSVSPILAVADYSEIWSILIPSEQYYIVLPLLNCQLLWPFIITPVTHCFLKVISSVDSSRYEQAVTQDY